MNMPRLPLAFFSAGALCALGGMAWGIYMASTQNFTMMPVHTHLNLVGWASLAIMGGFYALSGKSGRLGWINFFLSAGAVVVMVPSLAIMLAGNPSAEPAVIAGSLLAVLGMDTLAIIVLSGWRTAKAA